MAKKNFVFPPEFVEAFKKAFPGPNWSFVHTFVDQNMLNSVGMFLDEQKHFTMEPESIIKAFNMGKSHQVLDAAKNAVSRMKLYSEYLKLYDVYQGKKPVARHKARG